MREFSSYGPVDEDLHFAVPRRDLVESCAQQLIGAPGEGGHYLIIWAPRQTGKTWLMQQAKNEIESRCGDRFLVATTSMEGIAIDDGEPAEAFLKRVPWWFEETFGIDLPTAPPDWESFQQLFSRRRGQLDRPVILAIDEFDKLPRRVIDRLISLFRDMYLRRSGHCLHGLALIGVRGVLGVESERGSPFNIQRSLHVPNLSEDEVAELFRQYQHESGRKVEPDVVAEVCRVTRGQPGLVGWFGELLTDEKKYCPGKGRAIDLTVWTRAYRAALSREWNNTILNLVTKARGQYRDRVLHLFAKLRRVSRAHRSVRHADTWWARPTLQHSRIPFSHELLRQPTDEHSP